MSPTARTLQHLRQRGWLAQVVEQWIPRLNIRRDFLGVIDVIAVGEGYGVSVGCIGIQATSGDNHAARRSKALAEPRLRKWLEAGQHFQIWSWSRKVVRNKDGSKAKVRRWELRTEQITLDDLSPRNVSLEQKVVSKPGAAIRVEQITIPAEAKPLAAEAEKA